MLRFTSERPYGSMPSIADNLSLIRQRIHTSALNAGRDPSEITLIGVSKTHPAESIREAFAAGLLHFGENRVQEWEGKRSHLADISGKFTSHLIGHLQSNKVARAANSFNYIDSIDDFSLAQKLNRAVSQDPAAGKLPVLIEVHIGGEETKSGVTEEALLQLAERILEFNSLNLQGLMCIPPYAENPEEVRPFFIQLRKLKERLEAHLQIPIPRLSMGMSHDFEVAIAEGATEIRVGTAIFGTRTAP
jgi:pyridoxal phosphate enzyme (YggS family)